MGSFFEQVYFHEACAASQRLRDFWSKETLATLLGQVCLSKACEVSKLLEQVYFRGASGTSNRFDCEACRASILVRGLWTLLQRCQAMNFCEHAMGY